MTYRIKKKDDTVQDAVRRIAGEELGWAVANVEDPKLDVPRTVHEVRKQCKRVRGLIRLVKPAFDGFEKENAAIRDAAGTLSWLRDIHVFVDTHDNLLRQSSRCMNAEDFDGIRKFLVKQRRKQGNGKDAEKALKQFRKTIATARERAADWKIKGEGFASVSDGLGATYDRARTIMQQAEKKPDADKLHDWRKDVKYHWYHTRLLQGVWPAMLKPREEAADTLSDIIGEHHDLAVLHDLLEDKAPELGNRADLPAYLRLITERQRKLEKHAFALGRRLFAEETDALVARWGAYWSAWQAE